VSYPSVKIEKTPAVADTTPGHGQPNVRKVDMRHRNRTSRILWKNRPGHLPPFHDVCCWPECDEPSVDESVPLCQLHHLAAWRTFEKMALWPLQEVRRAILDRPPSAPRPAPDRPNRETVGLVYFLRLGNRVKIGFTRNIGSRLAVLPHDEVLGVAVGGFADEKRCHDAFAHLRTTGEWFKAEPDLLAFIADVTEPYDPEKHRVKRSA
jgi:hypothetical protein